MWGVLSTSPFYEGRTHTFQRRIPVLQKFLKTSKSLGDTGGAVFQSFSGYASKLEVSPSPLTLGTMGGYEMGQEPKAWLERHGLGTPPHPVCDHHISGLGWGQGIGVILVPPLTRKCQIEEDAIGGSCEKHPPFPGR